MQESKDDQALSPAARRMLGLDPPEPSASWTAATAQEYIRAGLVRVDLIGLEGRRNHRNSETPEPDQDISRDTPAPPEKEVVPKP